MKAGHTSEFLAIDWGTTNRRIYRIGTAGVVLETVRDDRGVVSVGSGEFPAEIVSIRRKMGDLPVICAGMAGSDRGWVELPHLPAPAGIADLAASLHWVDRGRTAIVPGVKWIEGGMVDAMRGEEVQLLGAVAGGLVPENALLCQPGTHCKWAVVKEGRISRVTTSITGELFALLKADSLLGTILVGQARPGESFLAGVAASVENDLLAALFRARADRVTGHCAIVDPTSYVSGLLIGSDVRPRVDQQSGDVWILSDPNLGELYSAAIAAVGGRATVIESHASFAIGICEIWNRK